MQIQEYISHQVFGQRLEQRVLVVYDEKCRYRDICLNLASDNIIVIDASESSITSRELAISCLSGLGQNGNKLLIYIPKAKPLTDEEKQLDPFSLYTVCGDVFPNGDGDSYLSLCLKAKPDHQTEIRQAFELDPNPSFDVINGIGGGLQWPTLRSLLKVESSTEIISALMVPEADQRSALEHNEAWVNEVKQLFKQVLGLNLTTRGKKWKAVSDELWRFVLFSEFVFDLPGTLPESLAGVPCANSVAQPIIETICDDLRQDLRKQDSYIQSAEQVERDLNLESLCDGMLDLGVRDTFPFEERTFLNAAIKYIEQGALEQLNELLSRHTRSIWSNRGENQTQWDLVAAAKSLIVVCDDLLRELPDHCATQESLIEFYLTHLKEADRLQREFEQAVSDYWDEQGLLQSVVDKARNQYSKLSTNVQLLFTKHLSAQGWPPQSRIFNANVFDEFVAPKLSESGQRVAYLMVDALRYELGLELEKQLKDEFEITLKPTFACLPSITVVGMASLLPGAGNDLVLRNKDDKLVPMLGEQVVASVEQRMAIFERRYGSRFVEMPVDKFVDLKEPLDSNIELAVLRSIEIDNQFENSPKTAPSVIMRELKNLRVAISKLQKQGFNHVVIATDHGFFMNRQAGAGDNCPKPAGNWYLTHERIALGSGKSDQHNYMVTAVQVGVKGDYSHVAGPNTMAAYRKGMPYFHGGASLQECVVPVMEIKLKPQAQPTFQHAEVTLSYKKGSQSITSRRPIIEVSISSDDLFSTEGSFEILLEAQKYRSTEIVGEAKIGGPVNAATRTITLQPGDSQKVTIIMDDDFEGTFFIKALNPNTLAEYAKLKLKTDYMV